MSNQRFRDSDGDFTRILSVSVGFCWKKMVGLGGLRDGRWQVVALDPLDDLAHGPGVVEAVTSPRVELLPFKGPKDHGIFHVNHQRRFIYKLDKGDIAHI